MTNGQLNILGAVYGLLDFTEVVSGLVNRAVSPQTLTVTASDSVFGDTWPGNQQSLTVVYNYDGGTPGVQATIENNAITISFDSAAAKSETTAKDPENVAAAEELIIYGATYGPMDVTAAVQALIAQQQLSITVNPQTLSGGVDPWPNVIKTLVVVGSYGGLPMVGPITQDGGTLTFTPENITATAVLINGDYSFCLDNQGTVWYMNAMAWQQQSGGISSICFMNDETSGYWSIPGPLTGDGPISQTSFFGGTTTQTNGNARQVYTGSDGEVWAIKSDSSLLQWDPINSTWSVQPGNLVQMAVVNIDMQWGLDANNNILSRSKENQAWNPVTPGPETSPITFITASDDGTLYVVDTDGAVFQYTGDELPWMPIGDPTFPVQSLTIPNIDNAWLVGIDGSVLFIGETSPAAATDSLSFKRVFFWDTESVFDETQSTHLYIVNRATLLAGSDAALGTFILNLLQPMQSPPGIDVFRTNMCQGLYDADFLSLYNNPNFLGISTWVSHFYDNSTGLNYKGNPAPTALTNGVRFFNVSVQAMINGDMSTAGYNLGLALHYFTDLTQPMHAGNYTYLTSFPWGYHTDFEEYTLANQAALNPQPVVTGLQSGGVNDPGTLYMNTSAYSKNNYLANILAAKDYLSWKVLPDQWQTAVLALLPNIINDAVANTAQLIYLWATLVQPGILKSANGTLAKKSLASA